MSDIRENMDKAIDSLKHNFAKVRTGRANANVLSDITVDYYGVATPITQVAAIKVPEAHMHRALGQGPRQRDRQGGHRLRSRHYPKLRRHCRSPAFPGPHGGAPS